MGLSWSSLGICDYISLLDSTLYSRVLNLIRCCPAKHLKRTFEFNMKTNRKDIQNTTEQHRRQIKKNLLKCYCIYYLLVSIILSMTWDRRREVGNLTYYPDPLSSSFSPPALASCRLCLLFLKKRKKEGRREGV